MLHFNPLISNIMREKLIITILISLLLSGCMPPDLSSLSQQIKSITVYDLEGLKGQKYTENDLEQAIKTDIEIETIKEILPRATYKRSWVLWKGSSLAMLKLNDDSEKRLAISYYGGFSSVLGTPGYFVFEDETDRDKFNKIFGGVIQNKFIPERIKRNKENSS